MKSIKSKISDFFRPYRNHKRQRYFLKKYGPPSGNYNILSNNCIGGMCYHDAGIEFLSPTINLYVSDFLTFASHVEKYLTCEVIEYKDVDEPYPVGLLKTDGFIPPIKIGFVHYNSFKEAKNKWYERSKRMLSNMGKLCIIYCVPKSKCLDKNELDLFLNLKCHKKLCLYRTTEINLPQNSENVSFVQIPAKYQQIDYSKYIGLLSRKRYFDYFVNIYKFLFK